MGDICSTIYPLEYLLPQSEENLRAGCDGVVGLIDDVLVYERSEEEHHQRLMKVLERLKKEGVTLNHNTCIFYTDVIHFLGQKVDKNGVSPDEEKVKVILNIPRPTNVSEVRIFLGMVDQLSKFSPNLHY